MMTLRFPTQAELTVRSFKSGRFKTIGAAAKAHGAEITRIWPSTTEYTFDDDTMVRTVGKGRSYQCEVLLP